MAAPVIVAGNLFSLSDLGDRIIVPAGAATMSLTLMGLDTLNTCKTQKRTSPGGTYVDQVIYKTDQFSTKVAVTAGEEWRVAPIKLQTFNEIRYTMHIAPVTAAPADETGSAAPA
jgi:hypothetical protein